MQTQNYDLVLDRIAALDLEPIKFKLIKDCGYSNDQVDILEKWYKRFLFLSCKYKGQSIVVSEAIDKFWHYHILDTQKYAEDCNCVFGEFLHHFPYLGLRGEEDQRVLHSAYNETLNLLRTEFYEDPVEEVRNIRGAEILGLLEDGPSSCSDGDIINPDLRRIPMDRRPRASDHARR